jgi:DNA-binding MarR family transcriptional regulator
MSKPNKMGMSDEQLAKFRKRRRTAEQVEESQQAARDMNPELHAIMDAVIIGEMSPEEAAKMVKEMQDD